MMEGMDSSSRLILSKLFEELIEWRHRRMREKRDLYKFIWSPFHLCVVQGYVLKFNLSSDSRLLNQARLLKDHKPAEYEDERVESFMMELREAFVLPEQQQQLLDQKHGIVAGFIDMLLRLLHSRPASVDSMRARIDHLQKELRFLLAVLGDKSFISHHQHEHVWNLLTEFAAVANQAGRLVHHFFFKTKVRKPFKGVGKLCDNFSRDMDRLKGAVIELAKLQQATREANATDPKKTDSNSLTDSIFIMDSLLHHLDGLVINADLLYQVRSLQQELTRLNSSVKICQHSEMEECLKENVIPIREVAYEAEYLINSFLDGGADAAAPHSYFSIRLSQVVNKIKSIETGVQEARKKNSDGIGVVSKFEELSLQNKRKNNPDVEEVIVGFEERENEILLHLQDGEDELKTVFIHGMPGVVSQQYDKKSLLIDIMVGLRGKQKWDKDDILNATEERLQVMIHQSLWRRRYLIVLDDIWSSDAWFDLQACFPNDQVGSRILFTSRSKDVALPNSITYELLPTSGEHCWEILREKLFQNKPCPPHLIRIGKEIAVSCRGLPLVVLLVVGILSTKDRDEGTWNEVKENLTSYVFSDSTQNISITHILELSYDNLQDHLKRCFLYLGAFPRARRIRVPELLRLWIAEGFVRKEERKSPESLAKEYLMELIDKSLVTVVERRSDGGVKTCVVHDLLYEFCLQKYGGEEVLHAVVDKRYSMSEKHQRLRIHYFVKSPRLPLFGLHVRSILGCFPKSGFLNMRLLRVLDLMGAMCYESLNEIKVLINLRHLAIGYGFPSQQPQPLELALLTTLTNLEFLIIKSQFYLVCTPSELAKMMKLRHVQVYTSVQFGEESCNISQEIHNNNLDFLSMVTISNAKDEQMLRCSPRLRRLKCKCQPFPVGGNGERGYPDFNFFTELESLHMEADPNRRVQEIRLPSNIIELTLYGLCMPWEKMSIIGRLRNLQDFKLISSLVGETWVTEDDEFEQLRFLTLKRVYELREWKVETWSHFPTLQGLIGEW
ncbi:hypothetical protein C2S51_014750 [Perilla frutescens var. frutescens]|nr:hypothetical protein C2S51_014750 [Perilla frutescens var. frutescens]